MEADRERKRECARNSMRPRKDTLRNKKEFRSSFTLPETGRPGKTAGGQAQAVSAIFVRNSRLSAVSQVLG